MNYSKSSLREKLGKNKKKSLDSPEKYKTVLDGFGTPNTRPGIDPTPIDNPIQDFTIPDPAPTPTPVTNPNATGYSAVDELTGKQQSGAFQGGTILDFLGDDMAGQYNSNLAGMLSGDAYAPYKAQSNEAFARAAQNLRARAAGSSGHMLGQGAANTAMQEADQTILSGLADKEMNEAIGEQNMKMQGMGMASNLAQANANLQQFKDNLELQYQGMASNEKLAADANWLTQQGIDMEKAKLYGYTDANGNHVSGLLELQSNAFNWDAMQLAMSIGDFDAAGKVWGNMFSNLDIDFSKIQGLQETENFNAGMEQMSKYIASGLDWDDALVAMQNDGTFTNLGLDEGEIQKMYEKLQVSANPVYQLLNSVDDNTLNMLFPDVDPEEAKSMIAKLSMFGGMTFNPDGSFSIDHEIFNTLFDNNTGGGTQNGTEESVVDLEKDFDTWSTEIPDKYDNLNLDQDVWADLGKPSVDDYVNWLENEGGEEYLTIYGNADRWADAGEELDDIAWAKGQYEYLDNLSAAERGREKRRLMLELFEGEMSPVDAKNTFKDIFNIVGKYAFDHNKSNSPNLPAAVLEDLKNDGYTESQADTLWKVWHAVKYGNLHLAYNYRYSQKHDGEWYLEDFEKWAQ